MVVPEVSQFGESNQEGANMETNTKVILSPLPKSKDGVKFKGKWEIEVYDNKENMNLISKSECHNIITNEGLNRILNTLLNAQTQVSPWYCSIFESNSTPLAAWTYHAYADSLVTEWTQFAETNRPEYVEAASSAQSTTNSANKAVFTATIGAKTLYGAALVSVTTISDHTAGANNVLLCAGVFGVAQPVIATNVVNLTYTITAADDGV
jgi:hypothetical protein